MPLEEQNIELQSEEVQEILGTPPNVLIRWGISVIALAVLVLLLFSYLIEYPSIIKGTAVISTKKPPVILIAPVSGKIEQVFVQNFDSVSINTPILLLENTANYNDVLYVDSALKYLDAIKNNTQTFSFNTALQLGEIQMEYNQFLNALNKQQFNDVNKIEENKMGEIKVQEAQYTYQKEKLKAQIALMKQELAMLEKNVYRDYDLYSKGAISQQQYNESQQALLQKQQMAESLQQSLYTVEIALSNLSSQLYDNQYALSTKSNEELMSYQNVRNALLAKIAWWKQQYLIVSPINGSISFINNLYENQFVNANEPIVSVIPPQNEMLAMVQVPLEGAGKIGKGQKVRFNLTNYPAAEFGYINGEIKSLSLIPNKDNFYYAEVILPNGLYTSSKKELNFTPNLQASAEIITQKERLINKIFIRFKELKDKIS